MPGLKKCIFFFWVAYFLGSVLSRQRTTIKHHTMCMPRSDTAEPKKLPAVTAGSWLPWNI